MEALFHLLLRISVGDNLKADLKRNSENNANKNKGQYAKNKKKEGYIKVQKVSNI